MATLADMYLLPPMQSMLRGHLRPHELLPQASFDLLYVITNVERLSLSLQIEEFPSRRTNCSPRLAPSDRIEELLAGICRLFEETIGALTSDLLEKEDGV